MIPIDPMRMLVTLIAGFFLGAWFMGWIRKAMDRLQRENRETVCEICKKKAYVSRCVRCRKSVGHCHAYRLLLADPDHNIPRPTRNVCTTCATAGEKEAFQKVAS